MDISDLDHSTASIHYANGSSVDISKIAGGTDYRNSMRTIYGPRRPAILMNESCSGYAPQKEALEAPRHRAINVQTLLGKVPTWLGGKPSRPNALLPMLHALKLSVEAYTEEPLQYAEVATPWMTTINLYTDLRAAFETLALVAPRYTLSPAGVLAWRQLEHICPLDIETCPGSSIVLSVDITESSMFAMVLEDECCIADTLGELYAPSMGLDTFLKSSEMLSFALRGLVESSVDPYDGTATSLSQVVLLGESGDSEHLRAIIQDIVADYKRPSFSVMDYMGVDPTYLASRAAAYDCWARQKLQDDEI